MLPLKFKSTVLGYLLIAFALCSWAPDGCAQGQHAVKIPARAVETRVLHFPKDVSLGGLFVTTPLDMNRTIEKADAKGTVRVAVPPGYLVGLTVGTNVWRNPAILKQQTYPGIDWVVVQTYGLGEDGKSVTDSIMDYMACFPGLQALNLERSDLSDAGLSKISALSHLKVLYAFNTEIEGKTLCSLRLLPLEILDLSVNSLAGADFSCLGDLKNLRELDLRNVNLTREAISQIAKCKNIEILHLNLNPKVDDTWMTEISKWNLTDVGLEGTSVTLNGLTKLKGKKIWRIELPPSIKLRTSVEQVRKMFPNCRLIGGGVGRATEDEKYLFAPLH